MPTLNQTSALLDMMDKDKRIKEVFDISGGKLFNLIDGLSDTQYYLLRRFYESGHIVKVKKFLDKRLPRNENPCPF